VCRFIYSVKVSSSVLDWSSWCRGRWSLEAAGTGRLLAEVGCWLLLGLRLERARSEDGGRARSCEAQKCSHRGESPKNLEFSQGIFHATK
jgi:hypothetical protein